MRERIMATIIDGDGERQITAEVVGDRLRVPAAELEPALGWELKPEGLCRGDVCVPLGNRPGVVVGGSVDVGAFAELMGRPVAIDIDNEVAVIADSVVDRRSQMRSLEAPDFSLADLEGNQIALRDFAGRKRLLVAWASW
jgi:hypothetical protein